MNKKHILMILVLLVVATIVAVGTIATLKYLDTQKNAASDPKQTREEEVAPKETIEPGMKDPIDEQKNNTAKAIEEDASSLTESDPVAAKKKYEEAEKAYKNAGNISKASEMDANAMTMKILIQQQSETSED